MKASFYGLMLLFFTGCVTVYLPTPHSSPMFSGKNEFQAAGSVGTGLNFRTAYSFTDHWGAAASYMYANNKSLNKLLDGNQWRTHSVGEISLGYYAKTKYNMYLDCFAGVGLGEGTADNINTTTGWDSFFFPGGTDHYKGKASYYKVYLQPTIGWTRRIISWNAGLRFSYVDFTKAVVTQNDDRINFGEKPRVLTSASSEIRVTLIKEKFYSSSQVSLMLYDTIEEDFIYYEFVAVSTGLLFKF